MRNKIFFMFLWLGFLNIYSQPIRTFTLQSEVNDRIIQGNNYKTSTVIYPFEDRKMISGLSISGKISLENEHSFVRVVLTDESQKEYLVYETYLMIADGKEFSFDNVCDETAILDNVIPYSLKIIVEEAELNLNSIELSQEKFFKSTTLSNNDLKDYLINEQVKEKIRRINKYNKENNICWFAGMTDIASLSYANKRKLFGENKDDYNSYGLEYYTGGFFTVGEYQEYENSMQASASLYPLTFDWRNRHGRNWITPLKRQGDGGSCWAFTAIAALEAMVNLYYNQKIDLDLSEQHIVSCNDNEAGNNVTGGYAYLALDFIKRQGAINESCFPFADEDVPCDNKCSNPRENIKVSGRTTVSTTNEDNIKKSLIFNGPLTSGISAKRPNNASVDHEMALVGYGVVKEGEVIHYKDENGIYQSYTMTSGHFLIGKTYWIFKNTYGESYGNNGYGYLVFHDKYRMRTPHAINLPIISKNHSDADIKCEDKDGDGYYYWGIGPKPSTCPDCAPDEPDGDDSDPTLGPLDQWGNCISINPLNTRITSSTTWNSPMDLCRNIVVASGTLTLSSGCVLNMQGPYTITINAGASLNINGGKINNGSVVALSGSSVSLRNNGYVKVPTGGEFGIRSGATFEHIYGHIDYR